MNDDINNPNNDLGGQVLAKPSSQNTPNNESVFDLNSLLEKQYVGDQSARFSDDVPHKRPDQDLNKNEIQNLNDLEKNFIKTSSTSGLNTTVVKSQLKDNSQNLENQDNKASIEDELLDSGITVLENDKETTAISSHGAIESDVKNYQTPSVKEVVLENKPLENNKQEKVIINSSSTKEEIKTEELEQSFNNSLETSTGFIQKQDSTSLSEETNLLSKILKKIKDKISLKKNDVKSRIEILRKEKEIIGKELEDIKELEETEQKIQEKINHLNTIEKELKDLEEEAKQELSQ